jgi:hypothetical protein
MAGEKKALTKEERDDIMWSLDYVMNSIKTYWKSEDFNRPFYAGHLKSALEKLEGDQK